jgi:hypothetical protein
MTAIDTVRFEHSNRESGIRSGEYFTVTRTDCGKGNHDKGGHSCLRAAQTWARVCVQRYVKDVERGQVLGGAR